MFNEGETTEKGQMEERVASGALREIGDAMIVELSSSRYRALGPHVMMPDESRDNVILANLTGASASVDEFPDRSVRRTSEPFVTVE